VSGPSLEDPEYRRRVVRMTLTVSPLGFVLAYVLTLLQGASHTFSLAMGLVLFVGCLCAAALFHLRGSKAGNDVVIIRIILALLGRR
jgi:hypothetical protein